jgi:hypothetical protein
MSHAGDVTKLFWSDCLDTQETHTCTFLLSLYTCVSGAQACMYIYIYMHVSVHIYARSYTCVGKTVYKVMHVDAVIYTSKFVCPCHQVFRIIIDLMSHILCNTLHGYISNRYADGQQHAILNAETRTQKHKQV